MNTRESYLITLSTAAKLLDTSVASIEALILSGRLRGMALGERGRRPLRRLTLRVFLADVTRLRDHADA